MPLKKLACEENETQQKVEENVSREVYGILCFKMGGAGVCLNVCQLLIAFTYCVSDSFDLKFYIQFIYIYSKQYMYKVLKSQTAQRLIKITILPLSQPSISKTYFLETGLMILAVYVDICHCVSD